MPIYDFKCRDCGSTTEELVKSSVKTIECIVCGSVARRQVSVPRVNWLSMGAQKHASPEAMIKFDRMHRQQKAKEEKCYADNGDYGPAYREY